MANRVVLGNRGNGDFGLYISKPGFNALTAADSDLLFSSNIKAFQMIQTGQVAISEGTTATITYPNNGYIPTVLVIPHFSGFLNVSDFSSSPKLYFYCDAISNTSASIYMYTSTAEGYAYSGVCTYGVLRIPYDG